MRNTDVSWETQRAHERLFAGPYDRARLEAFRGRFNFETWVNETLATDETWNDDYTENIEFDELWQEFRSDSPRMVVQFATGSSAFLENPDKESRGVLLQVADAVDRGVFEGIMRDVNGARVGTFGLVWSGDDSDTDGDQ